MHDHHIGYPVPYKSLPSNIIFILKRKFLTPKLNYMLKGKGNLKKIKLSILFCIILLVAYIGTVNNVGASIRREQILFQGHYLDINWLSYRYSGPYWVQSGKTITIEWVADRTVTVYILNQKDYEQWPKIGGPLLYRTYKTAQEGTLEYCVSYADNFYIVVMGYAGMATRLYSWTEKLVWYENDPISEFVQPAIILVFVALISITLVLILKTRKTKEL
ncbi:MAG: hypothetical protein QXR89_07790 [Candidatus Bathyarchaeia archaeon]